MKDPSEQPEMTLSQLQYRIQRLEKQLQNLEPATRQMVMLSVQETAEHLLPCLVNEKVDEGVRRPMGIRELAKLYGVCTETIRRWNKRGLLPKPYYSPGKKYVFDSELVQAHMRGLLVAQMAKTPSSPQDAPESSQPPLPPT